ncbi:4-hydroxybenzoate octaprenyltransferase [Rhodopirellula sp. MGV]|uniref:4-hydroxybenzoate octaprenyltransferase n=1 Tax=Rhodopirellula sp. MGV TaxID=2023130 RepID=UPI000B96E8E2|nr:4-hydroxybenzoate octaprenyltransferase [Rhodopirellula sp. MGV]OYP34388.1 4-hydroxybenzoate octaprenyltransferase [Rhodopirellula sp. MGV]PNY37438.1 4-hydroxybenzoate octaprenyltransferase [Rhodopirellula baltica]
MSQSAEHPQHRPSIADWLGLIRFSHTLFALPFATLATVMAFAAPLPDGQTPTLRWTDLVAILVCMVTARSAAMAFNRLVDRKIDAANPRTENRHLPAGRLSAPAVHAFVWINSIVFVGATAAFLPNWVPLAAALPVLAVVMGYSLAKRFTSAAHLWLGIALSLSPMCAWVAIRGPQSVLHPSDLIAPLLLAAAVAAWVTGFDIIYACQDADYDRSVKLHSVPARFGIAGALRIAAATHVLMLGFLVTLPLLAPGVGFGWLYWAALVVIFALVIRQHTLVSADDLGRVGQAFFHTNVAISVLLMVAGSIDCLWI